MTGASAPSSTSGGCDPIQAERRDGGAVGDLGLDASMVGWAGAGQEIIDVSAAPEREAGEVIEDDGESHQKIVEFLDGLKVL